MRRLRSPADDRCSRVKTTASVPQGGAPWDRWKHASWKHPRSTGFSYASSLWLGDGAGGFLKSSPAPGGRAIALSDVDGDGRDEVLFDVQGKLRDVGILRREADGTWRDLARR